jgi:hypothetical protein
MKIISSRNLKKLLDLKLGACIPTRSHQGLQYEFVMFFPFQNLSLDKSMSSSSSICVDFSQNQLEN